MRQFVLVMRIARAKTATAVLAGNIYPSREALARSRSRQTAGFSRQQPKQVGPRSGERGYSESAILTRVRYSTDRPSLSAVGVRSESRVGLAAFPAPAQ